MENAVNFLARGLIILGSLWFALASVVLMVLLSKSWKRRHDPVYVTDCPYCGGLGTIEFEGEEEVCPLCDGEAGVLVPLGEADE